MITPTQKNVEVAAYKQYLKNSNNDPGTNWRLAEESLRIFPPHGVALNAIYWPTMYNLGYHQAGLVRWTHCREVFENRWIETKAQKAQVIYLGGLAYVTFEPKQVATLLREAEINYLHLDEISEVKLVGFMAQGTADGKPSQVAENNIMWIELSPFWNGDPCRISFLTLFLRLASVVDNIKSFQRASQQFKYGDIMPSVETFLSGRTKFNGRWHGTGSKHFWVRVFAGCTQTKCEELLCR